MDAFIIEGKTLCKIVHHTADDTPYTVPSTTDGTAVLKENYDQVKGMKMGDASAAG